MASLEEDELVQMVQDFIESESTSSTTSTSSNCHNLTHRTQFFILQDILRSEGDATPETKVLKCVLKHMRGRKGVEKTTNLSRWLAVRMKMDGLNASICHTSWATSLGCPTEMIVGVVTVHGDEEGMPMTSVLESAEREKMVIIHSNDPILQTPQFRALTTSANN